MRQRQIAAAAAGGLILLALGGFLAVHALTSRDDNKLAAQTALPTTCADAYRVLKLRPSEVTAANQACLKQSLKLSGQLVGSVGEAYDISADSVAPTALCSEPKRWTAYPTASLALVVAGKGYRLRIAAPGVSEHQPLAVSSAAGMVELASISNPSIDWNQVTGGLNLNADGISGTLDVDLRQDVAGARPVHISGGWACGMSVLPTFDTSVPCANFYALNHLQEADVARIKASGCNAESLTFTEDVAGQVDHAVRDSIAGGFGFQADNVCTAGGDSYSASLKFSIGDETFLLDLGANKYGGVGPGQYDAHPSGITFGTALSLGSADPSDNGRFVADDNVFWLGQSGTFTIAADMKSGTIDAELKSPVSGSTVHIKGSWRCGA
jgi:hypothetical protein